MKARKVDAIQNEFDAPGRDLGDPFDAFAAKLIACDIAQYPWKIKRLFQLIRCGQARKNCGHGRKLEKGLKHLRMVMAVNDVGNGGQIIEEPGNPYAATFDLPCDCAKLRRIDRGFVT